MPQEPIGPNFIDTHTHVQFSAYNAADREAVLARAREVGVWMVNVGTQRDTSRMAVELAEQCAAAGNEGVFAAIGLHPVHTSKSFHDADELGGGDAAQSFISRAEVFDVEYYRKLAAHPKTVAIGECGLDYFHFNADEPREEQIRKQKDAFVAQIELSAEIKKPLMIHCRNGAGVDANAFAELIEILKNSKNKLDNAMASHQPGIIHFFTGTPDDARALLDLSFSFTFGGAVTFPPRKGQTSGSYDEVVKLIPADRILSETDAPYVAPVSRRGQRNEPAYIPEIVAKLAELKNISPDEMKAQIWKNAQRMFGI